MDDPRARVRAENLALVRRVIAGDESAWHEFVRRYAGLILSVLRRYLRRGDRDDVRTQFAEVLDSLRNTKLKSYEGRSALSTWITLVTRSHVIDHFRRQFGRGLDSQAWRRLSELDRRLFRLYYVEGLPLAEVANVLAEGNVRPSVDRLLARLRTIEDSLGDRWLRRLSYDLYAQSLGASAGRILEYLDHVRSELQMNEGAHSPEYYLAEREGRAMIDRVRGLLQQLPAAERRVLEMRFERGWSAERIALELGMHPRQTVYTLLYRVMRQLRRALGVEGEDERGTTP